MADNTVNFTINVNGTAVKGIAQIDDALEKVIVTAKKTDSVFNRIGAASLKFEAFANVTKNIAASFENAVAPEIKFDASLRELSAVTGVVGKGLEKIGENARESAKAFGVDAAGSLESYKILLSQLDPKIAENSGALKMMGDNVSVLSKSMGGNSIAAAETLTTAMNQFGISLDNPIEAAKTMSDMMNVMAAAAGVGSAELPQIQQALENTGMSAKAAGVSFEETNAAIQVLDKAGKKGSEGGIALRNVMTTLAKGRFLPKDVLEELQQAGVSVESLTNKNKSLSGRLKALKPVLQDTALLTKLFGSANVASSMALIEGTDTIKEYTKAISGTSAATDYAKTVMESFAEREARVNAKFEDLKISIFNATGDLGLWVSTMSKSLVPLAQMLPIITGLGSGILTLVKGPIVKLVTALKTATTAQVAFNTASGVGDAIGKGGLVSKALGGLSKLGAGSIGTGVGLFTAGVAAGGTVLYGIGKTLQMEVFGGRENERKRLDKEQKDRETAAWVAAQAEKTLQEKNDAIEKLKEETSELADSIGIYNEQWIDSMVAGVFSDKELSKSTPNVYQKQFKKNYSELINNLDSGKVTPENAIAASLLMKYGAAIDMNKGKEKFVQYSRENTKGDWETGWEQNPDWFELDITKLQKIIDVAKKNNPQSFDLPELTNTNNAELSQAADTIASGGKSTKNFNITINDGLVNGVQNYFNSSSDNPESATDFMRKLSNALQMVINDVNYAAN